VIGLAVPVPVRPPGLLVAVYPVIALPPLEAGALKTTTTWPSEAVTLEIVGAPGTEMGVTLLVAPDAAPVPAALVAVTVKV
jgi:hypothetical protein